ncbi:MAG: PEP-CTERM sorting domain-containing protein [Desulfococcaceae bacterium]
MKEFAIVGMAALFLLTAAGMAAAGPYGNPGLLVDTFGGNDPSNPNADLTELSDRVHQWLKAEGKDEYANLSLEFYAKVDADDGKREGDGSLDVTYDGASKSGAWSTGESVHLYSVKAGNQYALYWMDAATSGTWSTGDLLVGKKNIPAISHLSTWRFVGTPGGGGMNPVPEPGTVALMGLGLVGLAGTKLRKKS